MTTTEATTHAAEPHDDDHMEAAHDHHVCSTAAFVVIILSLLFLTFVTVLVSMFDFGAANMWIAMGIAGLKAALVMGVFMHMLWDTTINKLFFICSFLFLGLLFLFLFADMTARSDLEIIHGRAAPLNFKEMSEQSAPDSAEYKFHSQFEGKQETPK
jgi:cytochrome c oxidase subunit 4